MPYLDEYKEMIEQFQMDACTYPAFYRYWREALFERMTRLFVWEGTAREEGGKTVGVDPKQIEIRMILQGYTVISKLPGEEERTSFFGSMFTPTKYYDEWKDVNVRCPIYAGTRTIGQDAVIIDNCSLRNPSMMHVHHYATLLAHMEVTLINALVEARDSGGVPVAQTQKQFESIQGYQKKRFLGKIDTVTDIGGLGVGFAGSDRHTQQKIVEILETRNKILRDFYADIGVRSTFEKRSNVNSMEIDGDTSMLLLNISDMLRRRKEGAERVNELYGVDWRVHIAEEIDYGTENESTLPAGEEEGGQNDQDRTDL